MKAGKFLLLLSLLSIFAIPSSFAQNAACPKNEVLKMREAKMKAIEKLEGYEFDVAAKLVTQGLTHAKNACASDSYAIELYQLDGITKFYIQKYKEAEKAFRYFFKIQKNPKLMDKVANPKLVAFFNAVLTKYRNEIKHKKETKAKIKALENATGMPPEPKENPAVPLEHKPRTMGLRGKKIAVYCRTQDEIKAVKVIAYVEKDGNFKPLPMKKVGIRRYVIILDGNYTGTSVLKYYLMAFNAKDKPVAAAGNSAKPFMVPMKISDEGDTTETGKTVKSAETKTDKVQKTDKNAEKKTAKQVEKEDEEEKRDFTNEMPDEIKKAAKVTKMKKWDSGPVPLFYVSLTGGMGIGLVSDHTEALKAPVNTGFGKAMNSQLEIGYMKNRLNSFSVAIQMGFAYTSDDLYEDGQFSDRDFYFSSTMRNDLRVLLRYKRLSVPSDISGKWRWRYFWGLGLGGGRLRHEAPAQKTENGVTKDYDDTHFSSGMMFNAYGGAMLCLTDTCGINLLAEGGYTAAISFSPGNTNLAHFDFLFGMAFMF